VKAHNLIAVALGAGVCVGLYACGGSNSSPMPVQPAPPTQPQTIMLSVGDVLTKAQAPSETDDPFTVNAGAVTVNPSNSEDSDPVSVE
jgi:hypothetical protein